VVVEINKIKKIALITGLLLVVIVVANIVWNGPSSKETLNTSDNIPGKVTTSMEKEGNLLNSPGEADFFAEYRLQREQNRSRELQVLRELTRSEEQSKATRDAASLKIMRIMEDREKEMKAENLVKARGIEECVIISEAGMSTVVIKGSKSAVNEDEIKDLVGSVLKFNENKICMIFRGQEIE
jgi:stage III sporulation protein AH